MIGRITGKLVEVNGNIGLIETASGISYDVFLTPKLISQTPINTKFSIRTYLQVREDALILFGFQSNKEYELFKMLLTVSGVGPKTAYNVISFVSLDSLVSCVKNNDVEGITQVPGLGRKTAMKIILELSSKLKSEFDMKNMVVSEEDKTFIDALISLGYKSIEAKSMLVKLPKNLSLEEKIKFALKKSS
jgi:Holliday junction DNA helicase RuvA